MNKELLLSDIRRYQRMYRPEELPEKLVDYIDTMYTRKLDGDKSDTTRVHYKLIVNAVCEYYHQSLQEIAKRGRYSQQVRARRILCYLLFCRTQMTLKEIAKMLGYRNHTSVLNHRDTLLDLIETDSDLRQGLEKINELISNQLPKEATTPQE